MREIKFKAWSHKYKQMFHGRDVELWGQPKMGRVRTVSGRIDVEAELLQYTGMKDKNGVEIYEGDIFKNGNYTYKVVFHNGAFLLQHINKDNYLNLQYWGALSDLIEYKPHYKDVFDATDLIGNIYENPELLK